MKLLFCALFAGLIFGACFLVDRGVAALKGRVGQSGVVRMPLRYPVLAGALILGAAVLAFTAWQRKSLLYGLAAGVFAAVALYALYAYCTTGIRYGETGFTFRRGRLRRTFQFVDISGQRVAITRRGCCLVLCLGEAEVVLYSNMQGFSPFLEAAYLAWCQAKQLDPQAQDFHNPADYRWFPDQPEKERQ